MRTKTLQAVAVTLGLSVCTIAQAESPYTSPSKWNNFRTVSDHTETVPAPAADLPVPSHQYATPAPVPEASASVGTGCAPCESNGYSSAYSQAMSSPWVGSSSAYGGCNDGSCGVAARPALSPWFGSANLLFFQRANGRGRSMVSGDILGGFVRSGVVNPESSLGYDIGFGRYFGCGQYGVGLNYLNWDPSQEQVTVNDDLAGNPIVAGGGLRSDNIFYNDVDMNIDFGAGAVGQESVYEVINGAGAYDGAQGIRLTRDMSFQGIEANLFSFGLLGARRAAYAGCNPGLMGLGSGAGFGGAAGPLVRPTSGRARIMTSHGFRWFQVRDDFEAAFNIDGGAGYGDEDLYDRVNVENNLFGYQFGAMLNYCLTSRLNMNVGSKFGVYGNHVDYSHRLGTETQLAYLTAAGVDDIDVQSSDVSLAALGEFDLGLGYRINNAWSVRGGYRVLAVCGVADAVENMQDTAYNDISLVDDFDADDCHILHGAYVGMTFNW